MEASAADYTTSVPTETLHAIIEWLDDPKDLRAVVQVCTRWRQIAFAHPRQYCWFNCEYQYISRAMGRQNNELCYAQLRCRADHNKRLYISLQNMSADEIDRILCLLERNMARIAALSVCWEGRPLGSMVFDILSRRPAPRLDRLELHDYGRRGGSEGCTRLPSDIFGGDSPRLVDLTLTAIALPETPLRQFASVRSLGILHTGSAAPLALENIVGHFPSTTAAHFSTDTAILVRTPLPRRCAGWLAQLTRLTANETVVNALLDAHPELSALPIVSVGNTMWGRPGVAEERTPGRLLARWRDPTCQWDVRLRVEIDIYDARCFRLNFTARRPGGAADAVAQRQFRIASELLARADPLRALLITRLEIDHRALAAVWPLLAPGALEGLRLVIGATLSNSDWPAAPRAMPAMRQLVLAHGNSRVDAPHTRISARALVSFVRATFTRQTPRFCLRLENVDLEGSTRSTKRMFENIENGPYSHWWWSSL